jgi:tellurite resistance protein
MTTYTIELTDAEVKAMEYVAVSVQDWADNALKNRARQAVDEIYQSEVARMTADPDTTSIPADKEAVVLAADIKSAAVRNAESEAEMATPE